MANPKLLDFSAPDDDVVTIVFPDGKTTCELPTVEELSMAALQFLTANGEEWFGLFEKSAHTVTERKRFDQLNNLCVRALCATQPDGTPVPQAQIDALSTRQKAKIIVGFMTASPETVAQLQATIAARPSTTES